MLLFATCQYFFCILQHFLLHFVFFNIIIIFKGGVSININLGGNIRALREKRNLDQQELADILGVPRSTLACWENNIRMPKIEQILKIAEFFNVNLNIIYENFNNISPIDFDSDIIKIPVYGTIKAGIPIESQSDIIDYVDIPKDWTKGDKKFFGLKISGDSMFPKYNEDDIVIFEQNEDNTIYNGKDVAIMINGTESTFKKILVNEQGIVLQPYNTAYDIMMFSKEQVEQLPIKVVGVAREKRTKID